MLKANIPAERLKEKFFCVREAKLFCFSADFAGLELGELIIAGGILNIHNTVTEVIAKCEHYNNVVIRSLLRFI